MVYILDSVKFLSSMIRLGDSREAFGSGADIIRVFENPDLQ
jgi:hypothetical protein